MIPIDWGLAPVALITLVLSLIGFFGLFLVFFPGLTVIWVGQLIWALITGFNQDHARWQFILTIVIFVFNTILMIVGGLIDNIFVADNARQRSTPWWVIGAGMLAMVVGGIVFTPLGGLAAAMGVLFLIEYYRLNKDKKKAFESTKGWVTGFGTAAIVRLAMAALMIVTWLLMVAVL